MKNEEEEEEEEKSVQLNLLQFLSLYLMLWLIFLTLMFSGCSWPCRDNYVPRSEERYYFTEREILPISGVPLDLRANIMTDSHDSDPFIVPTGLTQNDETIYLSRVKYIEWIDERLSRLKNEYPDGRWDCLKIIITDQWSWGCKYEGRERQQLLDQDAKTQASCGQKGLPLDPDCPCRLRGMADNGNNRVEGDTTLIFPPQATVLELYVESYIRDEPLWEVK